LTNGYPNKNKNKNKNKNNKVKSKPLELFELAGKNEFRIVLTIVNADVSQGFVLKKRA
jgi:hypothetical protein